METKTANLENLEQEDLAILTLALSQYRFNQRLTLTEDGKERAKKLDNLVMEKFEELNGT